MKRGAGLHSCSKKDVEGLVKDSLGLVHFVAQRYIGRGVEYSDLVASGNLGLVVAAQRYAPVGGASFGTFAFYWIRGRILGAVSKALKQAGVPSLDVKFKERNTFKVMHYDPYFIGHGDPQFEAVDRKLDSIKLRCMIESATRKLKGKEFIVICRRYGLFTDSPPESLKQIGGHLGMTKQNVHIILTKALRKLRNSGYLREVSLN